MSIDQASAPSFSSRYRRLLAAYGPLAMALKTRPRPKLTLFDGGRRRFGDRTPGGADLKILQGERSREEDLNRDRRAEVRQQQRNAARGAVGAHRPAATCCVCWRPELSSGSAEGTMRRRRCNVALEN